MTGEETFFSVVLSILVPSLVFESFAARVVVLAVVLVVVVLVVGGAVDIGVLLSRGSP